VCGICGIVAFGEAPDRDVVAAMAERLVHRGPDAGGLHADGPAVLGHRRLAILDVSDASAQPMLDVSGRWCIVFNGEIYNFRELRRELEAEGAAFRSTGDTEVLLEAYRRWGPECLERLNGMFAFAVWDRRARTLFLARDRLGEKPLFYRPLPDGGVAFASELKALRACPQASGAVNPRAVRQYLALNYVLTSECIVEGVRKLPPGHFLLAAEGRRAEPVPYWDVAAAFRDKRRFRSEGEAAEAFAALLDDAVRIRMVSDVPLGAFLSGGVDSSAVVAAMCRHEPPHQVRTFSMGFAEKSYSELDEAEAVARFLGTDHHAHVAGDDLAGRLAEIVRAADEPFADTSMIPMYALAAFTRRHVTVSLSGDGCDEIMAGYETYAADRLCHLTRGVPRGVVRATARAFDRLWPVTFHKVSLDYKLRQFLAEHDRDVLKAHYGWRRIFTAPEAAALGGGALTAAGDAGDPLEAFRRFEGEVAGCHYLDRMMYVDLKTWLADDILVKVDRTTMAHSLEVRPPFLDHRLVEFAASLPVDLKMKRFQKKYLFKRSQRGRLPEATLRRPKAGFNAPVSHWLATTIGELFDRVVRGGTLGGALDRKRVDALWEDHVERRRDNGLKLFGLVCLGLWLDDA